jgi:hypothetical protein
VDPTDKELADALQASAVVNVMNEIGAATTDPDALLESARRARSMWEGEISLLAPTYVVCGGTYWVLEKLGALPGETRTARSGMRYCRGVSGATYLDFVHPANRIAHAMMYAWLRDTIQCLTED